jgi:hypothetical protein
MLHVKHFGKITSKNRTKPHGRALGQGFRGGILASRTRASGFTRAK